MDMLTPRKNRFRALLLPVIAVALSACGGGGGGSTNPPNVTPAPKTISGIVMLGPVANADVEIIGTSGVLVTGTTGADGRFGPLSYSGSYNGPLRVRATGRIGSTWVCDFRLGCAFDGSFRNWGTSVDFDGTLEAVVPTAVNGEFVAVSLLSNFASKRVDVLGTLSASNVNVANADIAAMIRTVLDDTPTKSACRWFDSAPGHHFTRIKSQSCISSSVSTRYFSPRRS